ncbi:MAG: chemotaxis protein CheW [Chloroflexota bacterium]
MLTGPGVPDRNQPAEYVAEHEASAVTLVRFELQGAIFALDLTRVGSVVEASTVRRSEGSDDERTFGTITAGSQVIPVRNLGQAGSDEVDVDSARVVILRDQPARGVLVDRILASRTVVSSAIVPMPDLMLERLGTTAAGGIVWHGDDVVELLFNPEAVDSEREESSGSDEARTLRRVRVAQRYGALDHTHSLEVRIGAPQDRWSIPMSIIRHIADYRPPLAVPGARSDIRGLLAWQGNPIPVIDPSETLGIEGGTGTGAKVVVIGPPGAPADLADCAIVVDWVHGLHTNLQVSKTVTRDAAGRELRVFPVTVIVAG